MRNIVDSSGWLEYFADGIHADRFAPVILDTENLLVPTVSLYEVFKKVILQRDEGQALRAIAVMQQAQIVELTSSIALTAAKISVEYRIPMADSIMLATARLCHAILWTQDSNFEKIEGVKYLGK
jgi:predicted nucleic acid-binding protein